MKRILSLTLALIMMLSMSTAVFATTDDITISDKKELYNHYQSAVEEAREKYNARIELKPFEEFDFSNAAPIEEFKASLKAIGEYQLKTPKLKFDKSNALTPEEHAKKVSEIQPMAFQTVTKSDYVSVGTKSVKIDITANIETYYSSFHDRQLISSNSYVSSIKSATSGYTWYSNYIDESIIDGGRTFYVVAQGYVVYSGMTWYDLRVSAEFYCSATGGIS
ncbi:hypothetical protein TEPIDINF_002548 [Tepidibacillus infernus]|uniref:hypothetical protein n=1 Tax=Tepidibacillus infernus TaxID=1806172 RepID=UPI003B716E8B